MTEGTKLLLKLVKDCQDVLTGYLVPDGYDSDKAVDAMLQMLDGPRWRQCRDALNAEEAGSARPSVFTYFFGRRQRPCEDCCDGYCTMNCGPEANMALSDLPFYQRPNTDDLGPQMLREAREDREEIRRLRAAIGRVREAASRPDSSRFHDDVWKAVCQMLDEST